MSLSKTAIEYATHCWNPLVGCSNEQCPCRADCWARAYLRRFNHGCADCREFRPHTHHARMRIPDSKTRRIIVANFLGDWLCGHEELSRLSLLCEMARHPGDIFLTLTKRPELIEDNMQTVNMPQVWLGASITKGWELRAAECLWSTVSPLKGWHRWLSCEPLMEDIGGVLNYISDLPYCNLPDWIVVGALTRNGRTVPPEKGGTRLEWVLRTATWCYENKVPCFVKRNVLGPDTSGWPRQLPWAAVERRKE